MLFIGIVSLFAIFSLKFATSASVIRINPNIWESSTKATVQTVFDASPHSKINGTQSVVPTLAVRDAIYGDLNSDLKTDSSTYYNRYRPYYPYYRPSYYPYYNWPYNHYNHPYYHRYPSYNNYYGHYYTGQYYYNPYRPYRPQRPYQPYRPLYRPPYRPPYSPPYRLPYRRPYPSYY